ncbi:aspartate-semialdehyde dehydrogenase [candidate division KSB1 bacterium]|nr:aspartate-semialdehyde dehydrogenase [candidate division KSB1 bacterium]
MMKQYSVGILGATGTVGQRFITLLEDHPWFEITAVAASSRSAGKPYEEAVQDRWAQKDPIPEAIKKLHVYEVEKDLKTIADECDFVFCALSMDKAKTRELENSYAGLELPVVSNNSAHRWTPDVPMILPEVNPHHLDVIEAQREKNDWRRGCIVVKPNCSIQSYVPVLEAWKSFQPEQVIVATYQAISGAGKTFETWPEIVDNVIPYIGGEEGKSEQEPMKIWGTVEDGVIHAAEKPVISASCIRVPVVDGHMAVVHVDFEKDPTKADLLEALEKFENPLAGLELPSAPEPFLIYFEEDDRPQTGLDRDAGNGMAVTVGRLREDTILDWKFVALSHNTVRGAAGGAVLTAELMAKKGFLG